MLVLLTWGRLARYHVFKPSTTYALPPADPTPLERFRKIDVWVTGELSVEGRQRLFVDVQGIYHTFETREHAVMVFVPQSRLGLVARSRGEYKGMWYLFFRPRQIKTIQAGDLTVGGQDRPALRVVYQGERKPESFCLAFGSEDDRITVVRDLWHDYGG